MGRSLLAGDGRASREAILGWLGRSGCCAGGCLQTMGLTMGLAMVVAMVVAMVMVMVMGMAMAGRGRM